MTYLEKVPKGAWVSLSDVAREPALRGVHQAQIEKAMRALAKKSLIEHKAQPGTGDQMRKAKSEVTLGPKFKAYLTRVKGVEQYQFKTPATRKKVLKAIFNKYRQLEDGLMKGGKHLIQDAADGLAKYTLEDLSDGELLSFAKWKGIVN